jgi:N-acetylmuramic acid 6-phosphate (MurNAc-6-P) etherase
MVARACDLSDDAVAADLLDRARNEVKTAIILHRLASGTASDARAVLDAYAGDLRSALEAIAARDTAPQ